MDSVQEILEFKERLLSCLLSQGLAHTGVRLGARRQVYWLVLRVKLTQAGVTIEKGASGEEVPP